MSIVDNLSIKMILDRLGLSQARFAEKIDVTPDTVSRWMTGKTKIPRVVELYLRQLSYFKTEID